MVNIKKVAYTDNLRQGTDKINHNFEAVVDEIETVDERVDTIISGGGPDKDPELVDIRNPDPAYTPDETITTAGGMTRAMQRSILGVADDLAAHKAETAEKNKLANINKRMAEGEAVKIVCYGDSITLGFKPVDPDRGSQVANPYPKVLQEKLQAMYGNTNITVSNNGHSGWKTDKALDQLSEVTTQNPDLVIIMFGINDALGGSANIQIPIPDFKENLIKMSREIIEIGSGVLLCAPTPTLIGVNDIIPYREAVKEVAAYLDVAFVDMNEEIYKLIFGKQLVPIDLIPDNLHLADDKYELIAEFLLPKLWYKSNDSNLTIMTNNEFSIPVVYSPYMQVDAPISNADIGLYKRQCYFNTTGTNRKIVFSFMNYADELSLYLIHARNLRGGILPIKHNGVEVARINFYTPSLNVDNETYLVKLTKGYHTIECLASDLEMGDSTNPDVAEAYFSAFVFKNENRYYLDAKPNLLGNGSGEFELYGWGGTTADFTTPISSDGSFSFWHTASVSTFVYIQSEQIPLSQGTYTASCELFNDNAKNAVVQIRFHDGGGSLITFEILDTDIPGRWVEKEITLNPPPGTAYAVIRLIAANNSSGAKGWRRIKVEKSNRKTAYVTTQGNDRLLYKKLLEVESQ